MRHEQRRLIWIAGALAVLCLASMAAPGNSPTGRDGEPRYIGAAKCKNCHASDESGNQYGAWCESKHSHAFEALASEEARSAGQERGVAEPQTSEKCLKCHVTAYGQPAERFKGKFDSTRGVQCESCHGPGEHHMKARFLAASQPDATGDYVAVPPTEIVTQPPREVCLGCHNEESPTFKPFCFKKRWQKIQHLDPRKPRTPEQLEAMKCQCDEECQCVHGECGAPHDAN